MTSAPHTLTINEIFHSIQGESSHAGRRCVFVRLTYCNIRCSYCDTKYAFEEGTVREIPELMRSIREFECKLVEITGGEPLFQPNVHELTRELCDEGFEVLLETGGSLDISVVDKRVKRIVDFKCPSSDMAKKNLWSNVDFLTRGDEVKFVIGNREDFDWSREMIAAYRIADKCPILMSVVFGELEPTQLAEWILADRVQARFQLQMHKYLWHPAARGV